MKGLTKWFVGIDGLKDMLDKKSMQIQYGQYQFTIDSLSDSLNKVIEARANNRSQEIIDYRMKEFIALYDKETLETALKAFYEGMVEVTPFAIRIPKTIREFTKNNRLKTQNMMKGVLSILLRGVKVYLAYHHFKATAAFLRISKRTGQLKYKKSLLICRL